MLRISENRRYLVHGKGTPFFYMGDTAWCLFHRLNREEADLYLETRARQGYTVIQAVVLAEHGGLTDPNANGDREFIDGDIRRPNEAYFRHVDYIVEKAASLGLHIGMLPTWGDKAGVNCWGDGPAHFINEDNARYWGEFVGRRYGRQPIIWILGGDRPGDCNEEIWRRMAAGIKATDGGGHLMTYHPMGGGHSSSAWFHNEDWLDFNMMQSGHQPFLRNWMGVASDYGRVPVKPCMDGEPCYEEHPASGDFLYMNEYHVRAAAYWAMLAGAHGHTYGCHAVWQFYDPATGRKPQNRPRRRWQDSLDLPGARQMLHVRRLFESRPFLTRIPDQSLVRAGQTFGMGHARASRDGVKGAADASYLMVYVGSPREILIDTGKIAGDTIRGWWFDPRTGEATEIGVFPKQPAQAFRPPADCMDLDWLLVLDDASKGYPAPGAKPVAR